MMDAALLDTVKRTVMSTHKKQGKHIRWEIEYEKIRKWGWNELHVMSKMVLELVWLETNCMGIRLVR